MIKITDVVQTKISLAEKLKPKSPLQKAREIAQNYIPDGKTLTKEQEQAAIKIDKFITGSYMGELMEKFLSDTSPISMKQQKILNEFKQLLENANVNKQIIKTLKNVKTVGEFNSYITNFQNLLGKYEFYPICDEAIKHRKGKSFSFEYEQLIYKKRIIFEDLIAKLFTMTAKPSTNAIVVKIENILKNKFGVKRALLNNDLVSARNILKSVKKLKENNISIPDEYIVSDFRFGGIFLRTDNGQKSTVLIGSSKNRDLYTSIRKKSCKCSDVNQEQKLISAWKKQCGFKHWSSSNALEHMESHEAVHGTHPILFAFMFQKINNKFQNTIKKISGYCANKPYCIHEVYTELKTKSLYQALEPEEQKLLKKLEG